MTISAKYRRRLLAETHSLGTRLERAWLADFGPRLTGEPLWRALGFGSRRAFERAAQLGKLKIRLYPLPSGNGRYARTDEVARVIWQEIQGRLAGDVRVAEAEPANKALPGNRNSKEDPMRRR